GVESRRRAAGEVVRRGPGQPAVLRAGDGRRPVHATGAVTAEAGRPLLPRHAAAARGGRDRRGRLRPLRPCGARRLHHLPRPRRQALPRTRLSPRRLAAGTPVACSLPGGTTDEEEAICHHYLRTRPAATGTTGSLPRGSYTPRWSTSPSPS